jgi:hypothetical protein
MIKNPAGLNILSAKFKVTRYRTGFYEEIIM